MKRIIVIIISMLVIIACGKGGGSSNTTNPVVVAHIYALMGQSNMVGSDIPDTRYTNEKILVLDLHNDLLVAEDPLFSGESVYPELVNGDGAGPGIGFAKEMITHLPNDDIIILVPCARGAASIAEQIYPNMTNMFGFYSERSLLDVCSERIEIAMSSTEYDTEFEGVLYWQGESDIFIKFEKWEDGIITIIETLQDQFGQFVFVFAQLATLSNAEPTTSEKWDLFKNNQYYFSMNNNISMIVTDDSSMYDSIHVDSESMITIGRRFADEF